MLYREGQEVKVGDHCRGRSVTGADVAGVVVETLNTVSGEQMQVQTHDLRGHVVDADGVTNAVTETRMVWCRPGESSLIARGGHSLFAQRAPARVAEAPTVEAAAPPTETTTPPAETTEPAAVTTAPPAATAEPSGETTTPPTAAAAPAEPPAEKTEPPATTDSPPAADPAPKSD